MNSIQIKKCSACGKALSIDNFWKNCKNKDGLQHKCKVCQRIYKRQHYLKNKQKYREQSKKWVGIFYIWWKEYKAQFKCERCGEDHPACIQFHHRDPKNKVATISELVTHRSRKKLIEEIEKCIPLCANCHSKEHYSEYFK
jgi:hypothetical protein